MRALFYSVFERFKIVVLFVFVLAQLSCNSNSDNEIYKVGSTFTFHAQILDATSEIETEFTFKMIVSDDFYPDLEQTKINWIKYKVGDEKELSSEWTGVEDSPDLFFLHPPRRDEFEILKFVSFPTIQRNSIKSETTYKSEGQISMSKSYQGVAVTEVKTIDEYIGMIKIENKELSADSLIVHQVNSSSISNIGEVKSTVLFHTEFGFVEILYYLPDGRSFIFRLVDHEDANK